MTAFPAGSPDVREVLRVLREALAAEVLPATTDRAQYVVRVACRLLDVVGAELDTDPATPQRLDDALSALGSESEAALAAAILDGTVDVENEALRSLIDEAVRWRVAIARPAAPGKRRPPA